MTKNIIACSLQRSGHNAILKWLLYQNENVDCFREWVPSTPIKSNINNSNFSNIFLVRYDSYLGIEVINPDCCNRFSSSGYHYRNMPDSSCLVWNFVDAPVQNVLDGCHFCQNIVDPTIIVIIRDWRNYVASHIKHWENDVSGGDPAWKRVRTNSFKEYADYFLDESPYYPILFDAWFSNKEYRVKICEDLGLHFTDIGKQSVSDFGGGSSFDLQEFDGKAEKMDVLNRYKLYKDNGQYKEFMEDEEAVELNNRIVEKYL